MGKEVLESLNSSNSFFDVKKTIYVFKGKEISEFNYDATLYAQGGGELLCCAQHNKSYVA